MSRSFPFGMWSTTWQSCQALASKENRIFQIAPVVIFANQLSAHAYLVIFVVITTCWLTLPWCEIATAPLFYFPASGKQCQVQVVGLEYGTQMRWGINTNQQHAKLKQCSHLSSERLHIKPAAVTGKCVLEAWREEEAQQGSAPAKLSIQVRQETQLMNTAETSTKNSFCAVWDGCLGYLGQQARK